MSNQELIELFQKHLAAAINRYRTDVLAEIDKNIETLLLEFKDHVVHRSWLAAQKWCRWQNEKYVLFPDYTRIYYRKGNREVLVQEYPPQVRVMTFKERLAVCDDSEESMQFEGDEGTKTYSLALPYIVFIFHFDNGIFSGLHVGFSDRPLKDCSETLYRPYLPNLDSNLRLCSGRDLDYAKFIAGNISQQAAYVLSHFWQTTYSDEWSAHYWNNKAHFEATDSRLASLSAWQEASIDNSLFVIENVAWLPLTASWAPLSEVRVGDVVSQVLENELVNAEFGDDIYNQIYQHFQDNIKKTIIDQFDSKSEKLNPTLVHQMAVELAGAMNHDDLQA